MGVKPKLLLKGRGNIGSETKPKWILQKGSKRFYDTGYFIFKKYIYVLYFIYLFFSTKCKYVKKVSEPEAIVQFASGSKVRSRWYYEL